MKKCQLFLLILELGKSVGMLVGGKDSEDKASPTPAKESQIRKVFVLLNFCRLDTN